jgi:hypothetical protein
MDVRKNFVDKYKETINALRELIHDCNQFLLALTPKDKIRTVFNRRVNITCTKDRTSRNWHVIANGYKIKTQHVCMIPQKEAKLYRQIHKLRKTILKALKTFHTIQKLNENST